MESCREGEPSLEGAPLGGPEAGGLRAPVRQAPAEGPPPPGGGVGVARPDQKRPVAESTRPAQPPAAPAHLPAVAGRAVTLPPAWGPAEAPLPPAPPLAPGTKCPARRPPGFLDSGARQRGSAGGRRGRIKRRWGVCTANINTASRFQPPFPACPTFPLARPPSRAAPSARPRAAGRGQGGRRPLLGLRCRDPPEAPLGAGRPGREARAPPGVSPSPPPRPPFRVPLTLPRPPPPAPGAFSSLKRCCKPAAEASVGLAGAVDVSSPTKARGEGRGLRVREDGLCR